MKNYYCKICKCEYTNEDICFGGDYNEYEYVCPYCFKMINFEIVSCPFMERNDYISELKDIINYHENLHERGNIITRINYDNHNALMHNIEQHSNYWINRDDVYGYKYDYEIPEMNIKITNNNFNFQNFTMLLENHKFRELFLIANIKIIKHGNKIINLENNNELITHFKNIEKIFDNNKIHYNININDFINTEKSSILMNNPNIKWYNPILKIALESPMHKIFWEDLIDSQNMLKKDAFDIGFYRVVNITPPNSNNLHIEIQGKQSQKCLNSIVGEAMVIEYCKIYNDNKMIIQGLI